MASPSPNNPVAALPTDVWSRILRHLSPADKTRIASTSRTLAQACRDSWHEQDYFTCARQPHKPASVRVAHGFAAPNDAERWLALTQQMRLAQAFANGARQIPTDNPVVRLMILALNESPMSRRYLAAEWPMYAKVLAAASRSQEAARFTQLTADVKTLEAAVRHGDATTIRRLTKASIPLPSDIEAYSAGLTENPHVADLLIDTLCDEGFSKKIGEIFVKSDMHARDALLASSAFQDRADMREMLFQAACRNWGRPDTIAEPLIALLARCSHEQFTQLALSPGVPVTYHRRGIWTLIPMYHDHDPQAKLLAAILPRWVAAGGDPNEILLREAPLLNAAAVALLCEHGACLHHALRVLSEESSLCHFACLTLKTLIRHGGRLTRAEYDAFIERCDALCAREPVKRYDIQDALKAFGMYDAIPAPSVRSKSLFGLRSRFFS